MSGHAAHQSVRCAYGSGGSWGHYNKLNVTHLNQYAQLRDPSLGQRGVAVHRRAVKEAPLWTASAVRRRYAEKRAAAGLIDPLSNLRNATFVLFDGEEDSEVFAQVRTGRTVSPDLLLLLLSFPLEPTSIRISL